MASVKQPNVNVAKILRKAEPEGASTLLQENRKYLIVPLSAIAPTTMPELLGTWKKIEVRDMPIMVDQLEVATAELPEPDPKWRDYLENGRLFKGRLGKSEKQR